MLKHIIIYTLVLYTSTVLAHGMVHEQIDRLSSQLQKSPDDVKLLLKRGRLYIEEKHFHAANADFIHVLKLDPDKRTAHYYLADIALKTGKHTEAIQQITFFINRLNGEAGALSRAYRLLGGAYEAQQKLELAANAYHQCIQQSTQPRPVFFLDLARVYQQNQQTAKALNAIELGIQALGPLLVLQQKALDIEYASSSYDDALKRVNRLIDKGQNLIAFYEYKARILEKTHKSIDAKHAYKMALLEYEKLPPARSNTKAMQILHKKLIAHINDET